MDRAFGVWVVLERGFRSEFTFHHCACVASSKIVYCVSVCFNIFCRVYVDLGAIVHACAFVCGIDSLSCSCMCAFHQFVFSSVCVYRFLDLPDEKCCVFSHVRHCASSFFCFHHGRFHQNGPAPLRTPSSSGAWKRLKHSSHEVLHTKVHS